MSVLDPSTATHVRDIAVADLYEGCSIFHEGEWVRITNIYPASRWDNHEAIITENGVYGVIADDVTIPAITIR
jgi:hypothetical protein